METCRFQMVKIVIYYIKYYLRMKKWLKILQNID